MLKNDDFQSGSLQNRCFQATFNPFYVAVEGPESRKTGLKQSMHYLRCLKVEFNHSNQ